MQVSRELKNIVIAQVKWTRDTMIFTMVRPMPTPHCGDLLWSKGCTQPLSRDPKIKLECHNCLPYINIML
jgi:hypothetical protein